MDDAPVLDAPDLFDSRRIRLADIDGSGVVDIVYLASDGVRLYLNRSGNSWSAPYKLASFPPIDNVASVSVTDLLGNGTACLVWSSPLPNEARAPLRYVDLMGGQKPHLLVGVENNLGAETRVQYASSTRYYLEDRLAGRPWITRLPFPVYVVERTETYDRISRNRFVTRFAYHHGYFDGVEREFRGFGMVEQWDTEEFAALNSDQRLSPDTNTDASSHVPPVLTRTWFHTGVYLDRDRISNFFAGLLDDKDTGEYYREPGLNDEQARRLLLDDTVVPPGLNVDEEREACRALKGAMLRQEVYALDGADKQPHPYSVTEQNFTIRLLQPQGENPHAVFFSHPHEAISYHYERVPLDTAEYLPTWYARRQAGALGPEEQAAAAKTAIHAGTPSVAHSDSLERTFLTVAHNRFKRSDTPPSDPPTEEFYSTRVVFDIEGNQREVIDAKDRVVMRYDYDMLGNRIHQASMEAGERWALADVAGKPIYAWDSRGHRFRTAYDALRRPTEAFLRESSGPEVLIELTVYGESQANPEVKNQRGKAVRLFDQAGVVTSEEYDFKGNLLASRRQLAREYKATLDWSLDVTLEGEVYTSSARFDALNRPISVTTPDISVYRPTFFDPNSSVVVRLAAERLGFTDIERRIIVGEPLTPPREPEEFWGSATVTALRTVWTLLDRSGLSFAELDALFSTWFIDPGNTVAISAKAGEPIDTCDTTKLRITGLTAEVLSRMHRFVRLWRRLGWTIAEVDRAIHALAPDPNTPVLTNETLVRLDHLNALSSQLRIPIAQTLAFWKPIDTAEPDSLYRRLFYNPAVFKPQDEDGRVVEESPV